MITEDYVSFETAKLLKEKGFNEATNRYYNAQYDSIRTVSDTLIMNWNDEEFMRRITMGGAVAIPTLQMAMKWLREVHNYLILIDVDDMLEGYQWAIYYADSHEITPHSEFIDKSSYEEACEAAIKYCLENLI